MSSSRSINSALVRLLGRCANPICVLDDQRTIRYANTACLEWLNVGADELINVRCDYHSSDQSERSEQIAARLCPPPEVFLGDRVTGQVARKTPDGALSYRSAEFLPLRDDENLTCGVLIFVDSHDLQVTPAGSAEADLDRTRLHQRLQAVRNQLGSRYRMDRLIGETAAMLRVRDQVQAAIASQARVVVVGPRGSGCEHVARTIFFGPHGNDESALVPLDCSLTDAELLQATVTSLRTQFESSHDVRLGTLLLLGVDQLSGDAQQELLGFLDLPSVDFTILATARAGLIERAEQGNFLPDLARALTTIEIELPPLANRRQDIPLLCQAALENHNARGEKQLSGFTDEALEMLVAYRWPENMDQLLALVGEACAMADGPLITVGDLPQAIRISVHADDRPPARVDTIVLDDWLANIEAELLRRAMARAKGNKTKAAELLSISRARLHRRLEQLAVKSE